MDFLLESESRLRQNVGRMVHSLWTCEGIDDSGLAAPFLDGRADLLGRYVMGLTDTGKDCSNSPENEIHGAKIPRVHCRDMSYERFTTKFMHPNLPVIINGLTDSWKASRDWVYKDKDGRAIPNIEYLAREFGSDKIPVYVQEQKGFGQTRPSLNDMTVEEYVVWWAYYKTQEASCREPSELLYLKDWKFVAAHSDYEAYEWPIYFRDDWLNQAMGHAYKFVYLGPGRFMSKRKYLT